MSRHGYVEDNRCRGRVMPAIRGKRGQKLLRELRDALDAMPVKELIAGRLVDDEGAVCALGCVGRARGIDMSSIDSDDQEQVAKALDIAEVLAREITCENDKYGWGKDLDAARWKWMRKWVEKHISGVATDRAATDRDMD